jgi:S-DNA-T family DNA segregation ATPase FtsK/SpoIIIE
VAAVARIKAKRRNPRSGSAPMVVGSLPTRLDPCVVASTTRLGHDKWFVPIGVGDHGLVPAGFTLHLGEHALIAGPSRSGRSTALSTVGRIVAAARDSMPRSKAPVIVVLPGPRSPLATLSAIDVVLPTAPEPHDIDRLAHLGRPALLLVDDAERFADPHGALAELLASQHPHVHLVAAGRADALRSLYQHWTRSVRLSRTGLLLDANVDLDGDLLGVTLPRRSLVARAPGRGWLVDGGGGLQVIQVACDQDALLT